MAAMANGAASQATIACAKEKFFQALVHTLALPALASDPRFSSFEARRKNRDALVAILADQFRRQPSAHWVSLLRGQVPIAPVRSMEAALDLKELRDRTMLASYPHP